jgi:hypothetical protein
VLSNSPRSIGLNLVKHALAPVVVRLHPGRGVLGMDGAHGAIADALEWLALPIEKFGASFDGAQVLEVGPGRTPQVCGAAVLAGATAATGIDVVRYLDPESDRAERLAPVLDILSSGRADNWCRATGTDIGEARRRTASFGARWPGRTSRKLRACTAHFAARPASVPTWPWRARGVTRVESTQPT